MNTSKAKFNGFNLKFAVISVLLTAYSVLLITNADSVSSGIISAVNRCLNVIIPSLFALMAMSDMILKSGAYIYIAKPFYFVTKYLLAIPNSLFFVFLLGNTAGYPIGIALLSSLVKKGEISKKTAEIMSCYCYGGGPAFLISAVGLAVFGSKKIGLIMFLTVFVSNMIIASVLNRIFRIKEECQNVKFTFNPQMFVSSVEKVSASLVKMCTMIIFFSTLTSILNALGIWNFLREVIKLSDNSITLLKSILEISCISQIDGCPYNLIPLITAVCGFGGVCVILQTVALCEHSFSLKPFLISRPLSFAVQYFVCKAVIWKFIPDYIAVSTINNKIIVDFNNFIPSICLIMMIFILLFRKRLDFFEHM